MNRRAETSQTWIGRSSVSSRFDLTYVWPSAEAAAQLQGSRFSAETLLETLLLSPFQQHQKSAAETFACFCCCWTGTTQRFASIQPNIQNCTSTWWDKREGNEGGGEERKKIVKNVVKIGWYWSVFCVFWCHVNNEVTSAFSRIEDSCNELNRRYPNMAETRRIALRN